MNYITLTDQKENKFTINADHIVGWQYIESLKKTTLILSIHNAGECVSIKETPEEIVTALREPKVKG